MNDYRWPPLYRPPTPQSSSVQLNPIPTPPSSTRSSPAPTQDDLSVDSAREEERRLRNEKARIRMARKRAEMKLQSPEVQAEYAQRERGYMTTYRAKNKGKLRKEETIRRLIRYKEEHHPKVFEAYINLRRANRHLARLKRAALNARGDVQPELDEDADISDIEWAVAQAVL
ncbi:hypothetical protein R3P38DRAFT_2986030 [Favolaschia claudopus]|uniref:Uncharacterized protein n=1 Tax=Favolaschia claudopus TaxID=2862362 RepID=A0AAW0AVH1_9AGAR